MVGNHTIPNPDNEFASMLVTNSSLSIVPRAHSNKGRTAKSLSEEFSGIRNGADERVADTSILHVPSQDPRGVVGCGSEYADLLESTGALVTT